MIQFYKIQHDKSDFMKFNESKSKRVIKVILLTFVSLFLILIQPLNAFAFNSDYLDVEKWAFNENVTSVYLDKKSSGENLEGFFKYYVDGNDASVYTYFSITESSLSSDNNDVRIQYSIVESQDSYGFAIDKDGICDALENEVSVMDVYENYSYHKNSDSGTYLSAIKFDDYEEKYIDISLFVNGHIYRNIIKEIQLCVDEDINPQTDESNSKSNSNAHGKATTKKGKTTTKKNTSSKNSTSGTTKFSQNKIFTTASSQKENKYEFNDNSGGYEDTAENPVSSYELQSAPSGSNKLTKSAKITLVISCVCALMGILLILIGVFCKTKKEDK